MLFLFIFYISVFDYENAKYFILSQIEKSLSLNIINVNFSNNCFVCLLPHCIVINVETIYSWQCENIMWKYCDLEFCPWHSPRPSHLTKEGK